MRYILFIINVSTNLFYIQLLILKEIIIFIMRHQQNRQYSQFLS